MMKEKTTHHLKEFMMTLLATTFSIVLTFGTSAIIERYQNAKAKKEMVMMIIYDFDKTLAQMQYADSILQKASEAEKELALHPEYYDSLRPIFMSVVGITMTEFLETTENIFSTNIETFNTLGNVNFVHEVSSFYNKRKFYKQTVYEDLLKEIQGSQLMVSVEGILSISFPLYGLYNGQGLVTMRNIRNHCVQMMNVSEKEMKEFSQQRTVTEGISKEDSIMLEQRVQDMLELSRMN